MMIFNFNLSLFKKTTALFMLLFLCACLNGCGKSKKPVKRDGAPKSPPVNLHKIPDAVPKVEPIKIHGNHFGKKGRTYKAKKRNYTVLKTSKNYKAKGHASWYGTLFHGRKTSSGEVYDMYKMTAAHRTLPIPTYAKVTNLDNGKTIIVKINDRGPFHGNRLIDLSYVAASKLGILGKGTGRVEVKSVDPRDHGRFIHRERGRKTTLANSLPALPSPGANAPPSPKGRREFAGTGLRKNLVASSKATKTTPTKIKTQQKKGQKITSSKGINGPKVVVRKAPPYN